MATRQITLYNPETDIAVEVTVSVEDARRAENDLHFATALMNSALQEKAVTIVELQQEDADNTDSANIEGHSQSAQQGDAVTCEESGGRGRGRGASSRNGSGRGGGFKTKPQPGPIATAPTLDASAKPKPKSLSTTETVPKNDPMWIDFDAEGFEGLTAYAAHNDFADTFEGFIPLVEREYDLIHTVDKNFAKFVSKSMFVWYSVQHLYARKISIKATRGLTTFDEDKLLVYIKGKIISI